MNIEVETVTCFDKDDTLTDLLTAEQRITHLNNVPHDHDEGSSNSFGIELPRTPSFQSTPGLSIITQLICNTDKPKDTFLSVIRNLTNDDVSNLEFLRYELLNNACKNEDFPFKGGSLKKKTSS